MYLEIHRFDDELLLFFSSFVCPFEKSMNYEIWISERENEKSTEKKCQLKYLLKGDFVMLKDINIYFVMSSEKKMMSLYLSSIFHHWNWFGIWLFFFMNCLNVKWCETRQWNWNIWNKLNATRGSNAHLFSANRCGFWAKILAW